MIGAAKVYINSVTNQLLIQGYIARFCTSLFKAAVRREANHTQVNMYLEASKRVQQIISEQFKLKKYLHFSFTHLVCRTAKEGTLLY